MSTLVAAVRIGRRTAALIGVLSVAAAIAVGHLVGSVVSPSSSPYLAVADAVVRLAPPWLVEFAKDTFGTADKPVLVAGMAVVLLAVAAGAGLAARERTAPATTAVVVLGLLAATAVVTAPTFAPIDLLAPAASLGAGMLVLRRLHALALPGPERSGGPSRRTLLTGALAAVGVGSLVAGGLGQLLATRSSGSREAVTTALRAAAVQRAAAVPASAAFGESIPFVTANADFYRIDTALRIPSGTAADWSLRVHGLVDRELTLRFDDLLARPLVERTVTLLCVSNPVGGDLVSTAVFTGVPLRDVLLEVGVRPGADQLLSTSSDGWTAGTPLDVLLEPDRGALIAIGMNGEALPPEHGFPVRLVVPGLYGYVSATKWVTDLEVTTFAARQAYWLQRGWGERGPIKTMTRIDLPRDGGTLPAGRVTVAGVAWSQPRGISRVEVAVDGGAWTDAELATEVSGDTWRMWRATVELAPGRHVIAARATDTDGVVQTDAVADVLPDGATGHPTRTVTVG